MDVQAVARHSAAQAGIDVDWQSETCVTVGATEALASAFMGMLNQGDEVRPAETSSLVPGVWPGACKKSRGSGRGHSGLKENTSLTSSYLCR